MGAGKSAAVAEQSQRVYDQCREAGLEVLLDDRDERPGVMFADWELIGIPVRITIGERGLKEGKLELLKRRGLVASECAIGDVVRAVRDLLRT
jgi:prolyl-tRNA synthetase